MISPELAGLQEVVAGRYSIEREIGRGGMGIVLLARDVALERPVAIKLLPPQFAHDLAMRERFVREARTAARLSHPNIVPIHSVEEHDAHVFFVMGYVDGETLTGRVRRSGPLPGREAIRLTQELAWALAYAHSAGVVHRDVKADNVLIDRASGRAMLTDFGIARVADSSSNTGRGEIVGTAQYVSPEQASGGPVDARSDLYSLGVTAFYALTGRMPFEAPTVVGLLGMHVMQPAPPVASMRDGLPWQLAAAVDRCLAKDPADRFASGEQLANAIGAARGAEVDVPPPVRGFLRDRARTVAELLAYYLAWLYIGAFVHVYGGRVLMPLGLLAALSVSRLVVSGRRLLRGGFGFADVQAALLADAASRREELGLANVTPADAERAIAARRRVGGAVAGVAIGVAMSAASLRAGQGVSWLLLTGGVAIIAAGALQVVRFARTQRAQRARVPSPIGQWFDAIWQGRFGAWFFKLAGWRLARESAAQRGTADGGAPTEVLLARAAEDLFASLPSSTRAQLEPAHDIVRRLQRQVTRLRAREEKLASAAAEAGEHPPRHAAGEADRALADRRAALASELDLACREAADRRATAVAALENIRLQMLRLRAGVGAPADFTADLDAAREIEHQISAIIEVNSLF